MNFDNHHSFKEMKDFLGEDITVVLLCQPVLSNSWLSFASWYSFKEFLPDAQFVLGCERPQAGESFFDYTWCHRADVPCFFYKGNVSNLITKIKNHGIRSYFLVVDCGTMLLGHLEDNVLDALKRNGVLNAHIFVKDVKEDQANFVKVNDCGGFTLSDYLNSEAPFDKAKMFSELAISENEKKVLGLWDQMDTVYRSLI